MNNFWQDSQSLGQSKSRVWGLLKDPPEWVSPTLTECSEIKFLSIQHCADDGEENGGTEYIPITITYCFLFILLIYLSFCVLLAWWSVTNMIS